MSAATFDYSQLSPGQLREMVQIQEELERRQILDACAKNPMHWARQWTKTENPKYLEQGLPFRAPFPDKTYMDVIMHLMLTKNRLFIPKSRELMTSWLGCAYLTHAAQWRPGFEGVIQTEHESKVKGLIRYCAALYENQEPWMRERYPLESQTTTELRWVNKSSIVGVPKGASQIRSKHPTCYMIDEAAFLPEFAECFDAANPVAHQIIAISSANPGPFANECL